MNRKIITLFLFFNFITSIFAINSVFVESSKNYESINGLGSQTKLVSDKFGNLYIGAVKRSSGADQIFVYTSCDEGRSWNTLSDYYGPLGAMKYDQKTPALSIDTNNNILYAFWVGADENHTNTFYFEKYDKQQYGNLQLKFASYKEGKWSSIQYLTDIGGYDNWVSLIKGSGPYSATNIYARNPGIGGKLKVVLYYQLYPSAAVDSKGNIYVAWCGPDENYIGYQIKFMKSTDQGKTWSKWTNLTTIQTNANSEHRYYAQMRPKVVVDKNDYVWIFYEGQTIAEKWGSGKQYQKIKYMYSTDEGQTFTSPVNLVGDDKIEKYVDAIVDKNNTIHIVWSGQLSGTLETEMRQIRYATIVGGVPSFDNQYISATTNYEQLYPSITLDENNDPVVYWSGNDAEHPVYEDGDPGTDTNWTGLYLMKSHYNSFSSSWSPYEVQGKGYHSFLAKSKKSKFVNGVYMIAKGKDDFHLMFFEDTDWAVNSAYFKPKPQTTGKSFLYSIPNPVDRALGNGHITFMYEIESKADIEMAVCDVYGKTVATLVKGSRDAGIHQFTWTGTKGFFSADDNEVVGTSDNLVERGVYLVYLKVGSKVQLVKKIFVK